MIARRKPDMYPGETADIARWCREGAPEGNVAQWEQTVAAFVGTRGGAAVSSGRHGMTLILRHIGIGAGDEVIIPAYTLKDLVPLIEDTGAKAVPADIELETLNVSGAAVERRISPRTKAVIALHAFGAPCPIEEIKALADRHGIPVVEDCAHSLGASANGRRTGSFGYAGFFSFETTKPVNTFGGGMVVSDDDALLESVRSQNGTGRHDVAPFKKKVRSSRLEELFFKTRIAFFPLYLLAHPRLKHPMTRLYRQAQNVPSEHLSYLPVQAELGLRKIATLEERIRARKKSVDLFRELLAPVIRIQQVREGCQSTWYFLVAVLPCEAGEVRRRLLLRGIDAALESEIADDCAAFLDYNDCPGAGNVYSRAIALPLYETISEEAVQRVARVLNHLVTEGS